MSEQVECQSTEPADMRGWRYIEDAETVEVGQCAGQGLADLLRTLADVVDDFEAQGWRCSIDGVAELVFVDARRGLFFKLGEPPISGDVPSRRPKPSITPAATPQVIESKD